MSDPINETDIQIDFEVLEPTDLVDPKDERIAELEEALRKISRVKPATNHAAWIEIIKSVASCALRGLTPSKVGGV